jgi:hypothetical protein
MTTPAPPVAPAWHALRQHWRALAVLGAAVLFIEIVLFHLPFFNSLGGQEITVQPTAVTLHSVEYAADPSAFVVTAAGGSIEITDLNQPISSIYVEPLFREGATVQSIELRYDDEDAGDRLGGSFQVVRDLPATHYISPILMGDVRRLVLTFNSSEVSADLRTIVLNRTIPFQFNVVRCLLLAALAGGAFAFVTAKAWRVRYDPSATAQRVINTTAVVGFVIFLTWGVALSEPTADGLSLISAGGGHYADLVDALLHGQVSLLEPPDPRLAEIDNPYDITLRNEAGIDYPWDTAYYQGRYYIYFGIVPALLFYLPFKALTGLYLAPAAVTLVALIVATVALFGFWNRFVRRYFPSLPYLLYLLGLGVLFACAQLGFLAWRAGDLEMVIAVAHAFTFTGLWLALRGIGDETTGPRPPALVGAAACLALAVGCRPTAVLISILCGFFLWEAIKPPTTPPATMRRALIEPSPGSTRWRDTLARGRDALVDHLPLLAAVAAPYLVVGVGLMCYNYIRFDSVFEFGTSYQLTVSNTGAFDEISPIGQFIKAIYGVWAYFGNTLDFKLTFPFFDVPYNVNLDGYIGHYYQIQPIGLINLPALWLLAATPLAVRSFRRHGQTMLAHLVVVALALGLILMVVEALMGGLLPRYEADFLWLFGLAAVGCAIAVHQAFERRDALPGPVLAGVSSLWVVTIIILSLFAVTASSNVFAHDYPVLYYRLVEFFSFW